MNQLIESIVFAILGAVVLVTGICIGAGVEVIVLGSLITVAAIVFIITSFVKSKKK